MNTLKRLMAILFIAVSIMLTQVCASAETATNASQEVQSEEQLITFRHWSYGILDYFSLSQLLKRPLGDYRPPKFTRYEIAVALVRAIDEKVGRDPETVRTNSDVTRRELIDSIFAMCIEYQVELERFGISSETTKWFPKQSTPLYQIATLK